MHKHIDDILEFKTIDDIVRTDEIEHIGKPHHGMTPHSGRYKWGSGENGFQRAKDWSGQVAKMRKSGLSDTDIAYKLGMSTSEFRNRNSLAKQEIREYNLSRIDELKDKGYTVSQISKELDLPEATVRMNLNEKVKRNISRNNEIKDNLEGLVSKYDYIDVGKGAAEQMGITKTALDKAIKSLEEDGYYLHTVYMPNVTNKDHWVEMKVLSKEPDRAIVSKNRDKIAPPLVQTDESGKTVLGLKPIKHMDWDRVQIVYAEDGGTDRDGFMYVRPGADGLDMGGSKYAQVRIGVGGTHYLKGMAGQGVGVDFPKGKDIIFFTNKTKDKTPQEVLKALKDDPDNPFGATIKKQKGHFNIVNEEGDWNQWSKTLSSQMLSKQDISLVKDRISATRKSQKEELDTLMNLTNPVVRKKLLTEYADGLNTKRYSLKLQGLPGMRAQVLIPLKGIKPNEVYAPNFEDGTRVALVRYPHGGKFEIPDLIVNNKIGNKQGKFMRGAKDAIGVDSSVAEKMSGADFDGDTAMVIPNRAGKIKAERSLKELRNFDSKSYWTPEKVTINTGREMGVVSNLITDMTLKGAPRSDIAKAVRHSMVVIDAEKHNLDWRKSERDNGVAALKKKYQTHIDPISGKTGMGASSLISLSKTKVATQTETYYKERTEAELKRNPNLKPIKKTRILKEERRVDLVKDAKKLGSGTPIENAYGDYINELTKTRDRIRKTVEKIPNLKRDPKMARKYAEQVNSLDDKLKKALRNAPYERQAQLIANRTVAEKRTSDMSKGDLKKLKNQAIIAARLKTGADGKNSRIFIEDDEWAAIQSGAISSTKLMNILQHADSDRVIKLATPSRKSKLSSSDISRIKSLYNRGYTQSQIAEMFDISPSTVTTIV